MGKFYCNPQQKDYDIFGESTLELSLPEEIEVKVGADR